MAVRIGRGYGQHGGVARALELVGERWALLIVRDLLAGARRYSDLKASLPRIPTNILSDRLRELQDTGVVRRAPVVRGGYELTDLGRALEPVVVELERWGWAVAADPSDGDVLSADALASTLRAAFRPDAARETPPTEYVLHVDGVSVSAVVADGALDTTPVGPGALPSPRRRTPIPAAVLELDLALPDLRRLLVAGRTTAAGDPDLLARFTRTFRIEPGPGPRADADRATEAA